VKVKGLISIIVIFLIITGFNPKKALVVSFIKIFTFYTILAILTKNKFGVSHGTENQTSKIEFDRGTAQ